MGRSRGEGGDLSRRRCLRLLGLGAVGVTTAGLLAACGAGGTATTGAGTTSAGAVTAASLTVSGSTSAAGAATTAKAATSSAAATASGPTPTAVPAPKSSGKGNIVFELPGLDVQQAAVFQQMIDNFTKQTNIKVEVANTGLNWEKFAVQFAGGSGGDLYEYETKQMPHYAALDVFENLDPYIAKSKIVQPSDYFAITWSKGKVKGHQYAVPWDTTPVALYYNKDLFQQAGLQPPPTAWGDSAWDWNAFLSAAQKLTKPDKSAFGVDISTWWVYSLPWIWSNGGHVVNEQLTKTQYSQQAVQDAWQFMVDLRWKYNVWAQTTQKHASFATGGVGMMLSGPYTIPSLRATAKIPWDVAPVPKGKAGVWTRDPSDSLTIWQGSKNKDEAFQLLEYITGPDGQLIIGKGGRGVPARKAVAQSKEFLNQGDGINWQVFADGVDHEGLQAVTDVWPEMDSEVGKVIGPMWDNKASVSETTTKLDQVIQAILDKATVRRDLSQSYIPEGGWKSPSYS